MSEQFAVVTRYGVPVMRKTFEDYVSARAFMTKLRFKRWDGLRVQRWAA